MISPGGTSSKRPSASAVDSLLSEESGPDGRESVKLTLRSLPEFPISTNSSPNVPTICFIHFAHFASNQVQFWRKENLFDQILKAFLIGQQSLCSPFIHQQVAETHKSAGTAIEENKPAP